MVGTTVSHYKILEKLGEGGMAVVYKAHDTKLDRDVALKFLAHLLKVSETDQARFLQEARSAALLNHPNICTIYDVLDLDEETLGGKQSVIVMEYVDGKSLRDMLPLSTIKQGTELGIQIASGLAAAHEKGLIHRDIKPENIMVFKGGRAVIMDFGLAKLKGSLSLTKTGTTVGTVKYMSPEQVCGGEVDHRSDIFSLGVVLYELFTGHAPFKGEHEAAVLYEIANAEPPLPSHHKPEIPKEIESVILECLAKDPNDRLQSAAEVRRRLSAASGTSKTVGKTVRLSTTETRSAEGHDDLSSKKRLVLRRTPILSGLVVLFGLAVLVISMLYLLRPPRGLDFSSVTFTQITGEIEYEDQGIFSPDGKSIAYVRDVKNKSQLFVKTLDAGALPVQLTTGGDVYNPFWSSTGDRIYYLQNDSLWSIGTAGGEPRRLFDSTSCASAAVSPDGTMLLMWGPTTIDSNKVRGSASAVFSLLVSSPIGAPPRKLTPSPYETSQPIVPAYLNISPDGSTVAFSRSKPEGGGAFWLIPLHGDGMPRMVSWDREVPRAVSFDWFSDSRTIIMALEGKLWFGDTRTGRLMRATAMTEGNSGPRVSPDGRRILFSTPRVDLDIAEVPLDGGPTSTLVGSNFIELNPSWSASGEKMAYVTNRSGKPSIWIRNTKEDVRAIVTGEEFTSDSTLSLGYAVISPDGKRVAYVRVGKNTGFRLYVSPTEGGRPTRLSDEFIGSLPSWSPDSRRLVTFVYRTAFINALKVLTIGAQDSARTLRDSLDVWSPPNWSPRGDWIACGISQDNILLVAPDGKQMRTLKSPVRISATDYSLTWSKDGSALYVLSSSGNESRLDEVNIGTGRSRKLAGYGCSIVFGGGRNYGFLSTLSPDGRSLTTSVRKTSSDIWMMEGFPAPETLW